MKAQHTISATPDNPDSQVRRPTSGRITVLALLTAGDLHPAYPRFHPMSPASTILEELH